jgi:hypothetical protein
MVAGKLWIFCGFYVHFASFSVHSNSKFRVFATEAFRSEKSTETTDISTEVSGEINETFEAVSITPKFRFWKNL